jgi:antibiotic biosynthesis monooxygenase (ABM) superfamily enzyme
VAPAAGIIDSPDRRAHTAGLNQEKPMAVVIFVVKANIDADQEDAFNEWYSKEHCPQLLRFSGAVSARRYKRILGDEKYEYMAIYEFESEETFQRFQESDHLKELISEYNAHFETTSERERFAYTQIWP